ncbi:MAG: glycyl-radical enzyme activating protein [Armatimonadota bacterium]
MSGRTARINSTSRRAEQAADGDSLAARRGIVFDIERFAVHDGPGIRTTVFLKGCPLRCLWCHNPEALSRKPQLAQFKQNCIACGACIRNCPRDALTASPDGIVIDRALCDDCGACTEECYAEALVMSGREMTAAEVVDEVKKDGVFYANSGGGMTISGGEPLLQPDFTEALLALAREAEIHTCIDTSGCGPWRLIEPLLPLTDLILYDLKTLSAEAHREFVGGSLDGVIDNLKRICADSIPVRLRVPVVPGCTDMPDNIAAIADLAATLPAVEAVELLRYHRLGESKYGTLGLTYPLTGLEPSTDEQMSALAAIVQNRGVECKLSA